MKRKQADEKLQYWRRLLDEQPRSGMTVKAFCQQNHVSVPSFYSWRRKVEQHDSTVSQNQHCAIMVVSCQWGMDKGTHLFFAEPWAKIRGRTSLFWGHVRERLWLVKPAIT